MMKKTLLTTGLIAFAFGAFAQFTANRLVVTQYGDGASALDATATSVFLKEFPLTPAIPFVTPAVSTYSLAMPTAVNGANKPLTGQGNAGNEGLLTLSTDGNFLNLFGYALVPNSTVAKADTKTIATISANGVINTTTTVPGSNTFEQPRSAISVDGSEFWFNFNGGGIRYTTLGAATNTAVNSSPLGSVRSTNIFNGQLYETTNSTAVGAFHVGKITATASGNKLPKSTEVNNANTAPIEMPGISASTSPNQVVFLNSSLVSGEPDVIYVANDDSGFIEKWVYSPTAIPTPTWVLKGTVTASSAVGAENIKGITARIIGGTAFVYANTATSIVSLTDVNAISSTISDVLTPIAIIATAPVNTAFKGIAFTPGTITATVLPIKLSSFTGKSTLNGVQLSWTTASEKNNRRFEVLSSTDGNSFNEIGEVAGSGNSNVALNYSYLDRNVVEGANYYKLKQVDGDGRIEEFGPVVVTVNGQPADLSVYANKASGQIKLTVYANQAGNATVNIYDANGRVVASQNINIQAGNNEVSLNSQTMGSGLHIASLTVDGVTLTKKFIFQ